MVLFFTFVGGSWRHIPLRSSVRLLCTWNFSYDTLNRLTATQNTAVTSVSPQYAGAYGCWTYDPFGNRTLEAYSTATSTPCAHGANDNLQDEATPQNTTLNNNQLATSVATYDAAGNVLNDGYNNYWYDPEGRLCAVAYPNGSGGNYYEQYLYDAEGGRVGKAQASSLSCPTSTSTPSTEYLLGQGGEQVTELNGSGSVQHTNVFAGGKLLATYDFLSPGLHFAIADPLGTKRVQVSGTGTPELDFLSLPFGNNIGNPRATYSVGTGTDATEIHFTGKERDAESGNDYFGARYYASSMGRFMSPDWSSKAEPVPYAKLNDPQSLNLYSYVRNNPLTKVDADGHCFEDLCVFETIAAYAVVTAVIHTAAAYMASPAYQENSRQLANAVSQLSSKVSNALHKDAPAPTTGDKNTTPAAQTNPTGPAQPKSNPWTGTPGSTSTTLAPDGTPKQAREYGPDGYPKTDVDFGHDHGQGDPHAHDTGRPSDGSPPTASDRAPGRPVQPTDPKPQPPPNPQP